MKQFKFLGFIFAALLLCAFITAPAFAADTGPAAGAAIENPATATGTALTEIVTETVAPLIGAVLAGLASLVLLALKKKFGIEVSEAMNNRIRGAAFDAANYAAEYAARKSKLETITIGGSKKLDIAIGHMLEAVPGMTKEQADKAIHAVLPRLSGEGSTGAQVTS